MDAKRMQHAAEWLHSTVFKDEAIRPRPAAKSEPLPPLILSARSLENGRYQKWQSMDSVFMKQGKLLANYEDDYAYDGDLKCYYPTYQALTNRELRGYFSWRTKLRQGEVTECPLSFAFLYVYELLNQIGVSDPMDGYRKLAAFREAYGALDKRILSYLQRWMADYVVYYGLPAALLSDSPQLIREQSIAIMEDIPGRDTEEMIRAVKTLSSGGLEHSRFYAENRQEMDTVIVRVLERVSAHYAARCKKSMAEQYFGSLEEAPALMFESAVFCNPLKRRSYAYPVSGQYAYRCENGRWFVRRHFSPPGDASRLDALLKTIESVMRRQMNYRYPLKSKLDQKWLLRIIEEETGALLAQKKAAEERKVTIRYAQLDKIRQDAAFTQQKLMVEEEMDRPLGPEVLQAQSSMAPESPAPQKQPVFKPESPAPQEQPSIMPESPALQARPSFTPEPAGGEEAALSPPEYRLLQCLLYGGDTGWVQAEGYLLSVLVDGINEKLYERFQDTVLDGGAQPLEDYIEDLKGMVCP